MMKDVRKLIPGILKVRNSIPDMKDMPEVYFGFIQNREVNALADVIDGRGYVGMFCGTVELLHDLFLRLLAHPGVLTSIGDPSKERINLQHSEGVTRNAEKLVEWREGRSLPASLSLRLQRHAKGCREAFQRFKGNAPLATGETAEAHPVHADLIGEARNRVPTGFDGSLQFLANIIRNAH